MTGKVNIDGLALISESLVGTNFMGATVDGDRRCEIT